MSFHLGEWTQGSRRADVLIQSYGVRLGYQDVEWGGGIDYMAGSGSDHGSPEKDISTKDIGIFVSYSMPLLLRVFAEFGFLTKASYQSSSSVDKLEGASMKLGVGYFWYQYLTLNLEYYAATFSKDGGHQLDTKVEQQTYGLSLSFPFEF